MSMISGNMAWRGKRRRARKPRWYELPYDERIDEISDSAADRKIVHVAHHDPLERVQLEASDPDLYALAAEALGWEGT